MISVKKIPQIPIYLIGKAFWKGYLDWINNFLLRQNLVSRTFCKYDPHH